MRLVIVSDTHEQHAQLAIPDGDVFIHCGDITIDSDLGQIKAFGNWVAALPHRYKLIIAGNHDAVFEHVRDRAVSSLYGRHRKLARCPTYLQDSGLTLDGVRFWGSPWQPWYYDMAFNLRRGPALAAKWALIPDSTDVLITHGPPHGILDQVRGQHVGCAALTQRLAWVRPKVHAFGHIHAASGVEVHGGTTYVNASICGDEYRPVHPVRIVDL